MALSPDEIERRQFTVTLRGYHTAEVDAFLRQIAAELRSAPPPVAARPPVEELRPGGDMATGPAFGRVAHTIASLLQTAAESAAGIRRDAEEEAAAVRARSDQERQAAHAEASRIVEHARREAAELRARAAAEHDRLASIDKDLRQRLEAAAESLFRSLHQPLVGDPLALPVLSLPDEERRIAAQPVHEWADG